MNASVTPFPAAAGVPAASLDVDLASSAFLENPWDVLHALQDRDRMFWSDRQNGWIVTRHEDVMAALTDSEQRFSAERILPWLNQLEGITEDRYPATIRYFATNLGFRDGRDHFRLRRLFMKAFSAMSTAAMRPAVKAIVNDLLDYAERRGEVEFLSEMAVMLPTRLISHILGIPEALRADFHVWATNVQASATAATLTYDHARTLEDNLAAMTRVLLDEIALRRAQPRDDLLSYMVRTVDEGGDKLSEEEMVSCAQVMIVGGFDTTVHALTMGLRTLVQRPVAVEYMLADEANVGSTVMELLRFVSPVRGMVRIAARDFGWLGKTVREGDIVYLMLDAANHDPRVWKAPEDFNVARTFGNNVIFGGGIHNCLGQHVAKLELAEFFPALFRRFPEIALLPTRDVYLPSYAIRGIQALPVRFSAAA